ncbi:MAG: ATP-binding protein [Chloroflexota bacterium]|nr:ATP-binding protein [Chloroflexota bacterium]
MSSLDDTTPSHPQPTPSLTLEAAQARITDLETRLAAAEAATRQTAAGYQQVIDNLPMRIFWKDRDSRYRGVNRQMLVDLGQPDPAKVIGRSDVDLGMPESAAYHSDDQHVMTSGEPMRDKEERVIAPTGEVYYTTTTKIPLRAPDATIEGIIGTYYDITPRKLRELMLEKLVKQTIDIIDLSDSLGDALTAADLLEQLSKIGVAEHADALTFFSNIIGPDGTTIEVEIAANYTRAGVTVPTLPISMRYPASDFSLPKLYIDEPETNLLIENVSLDPRVDPIARGNLLYLNIHSLIIVPLYRYERHMGAIMISFSAPRTFTPEEREYFDKLPPLLTQIVERLRLLDELRASVNELNAALIFKDQFLAIMSHELRTPLNAILGYSSIAMQMDAGQPGAADKIKHMMTRVVANSDRLLSLINAILDLSRINAGRIEIVAEPFDLHELARSWQEDFAERVTGKNLAFQFTLDETLPAQIVGDHERITQIVGNLIENAVKFTEQGSIDLLVRNQGGRLCIQVHDTGIGISPTWHHLIFEEFRRVEMDSVRKTGGAGLGLSIVQRLAQLMGGGVTVESEIGKGSTFTITLPIVPIPTVTPALTSEGA